MIFSSLVHTLNKGYFKNQLPVRKVECCFKEMFMHESLLFIGAGMGGLMKTYKLITDKLITDKLIS